MAAVAASCSADSGEQSSTSGSGGSGTAGATGSGGTGASQTDSGTLGGSAGFGATSGTGAMPATGARPASGIGGEVIIFDASADSFAPPPPDSGPIVEELVPCTTNEDCCAAIEECTDPSTYICTVDHYCGLISGTCTGQNDCQGDTYCCDATCRLDGVNSPVCIPAYVPPGAPCVEVVNLGVFSPDIQCDWTGPVGSEPLPNHKYVLTTPLVADTPIDSGESAEIVVITYNGTDGIVNPSYDSTKWGVLRIISGQDCSLLYTIDDSANLLRASATPALADLDSDGFIDIVARRNDWGVVAYRWNSSTSAYELYWSNSNAAETMDISAAQAWDGPSIHDVNGDGAPEVLVREMVYNGQTGARISDGVNNSNAATFPWNGYIPIVADMDGDHAVELVTTEGWSGIGVYRWSGSDWTVVGSWFGDTPATQYAVADFGTPGASAGQFDSTTLDGIAEIVAVNAEGDGVNGQVRVYTLTQQIVLSVNTGGNESGGPPVIGDFDNDGFPEFGIAGATRMRVFDFDCATGGAGCESAYVRWSQPSQDSSSRQTGAAIFDFDGDGKAEAVYADECFLRVYEGDTGNVLFSAYRTSGTWYEGPVIADVDMDQNTEIVVNNNNTGVICPATGSPGTPYVDPIHPGVRCDDDGGCMEGSSCVSGFCRCTTDAQCCLVGETLEQCGLTCAAGVGDSADGNGNVCRATHPNSAAGLSGIRILRDRLDRWASSRPMWNQHAYSITNINDDGTIPSTANWQRNWTVPGLNNFRQNRQGVTGIQDLPDITGALTSEEPCVTGQLGATYLQATVCNRGTRAVGAELPATFYLGDPADGNVLCTSYTDGPVPTGGCKMVYCAVTSDVVGSEVTIVVNDDGNGGRTTVECRPDNNSDSIMVSACDTSVPY